jgi:hypothetical protein
MKIRPIFGRPCFHAFFGRQLTVQFCWCAQIFLKFFGSCRKVTFSPPYVTLEILNSLMKALSLHVHRFDCTSIITSTAASTIYHSRRRLHWQAACLVVVIVHSESSSHKAGRQRWLVYMNSMSTKAASCSVAIFRYDLCSTGSLSS